MVVPALVSSLHGGSFCCFPYISSHFVNAVRHVVTVKHPLMQEELKIKRRLYTKLERTDFRADPSIISCSSLRCNLKADPSYNEDIKGGSKQREVNKINYILQMLLNRSWNINTLLENKRQIEEFLMELSKQLSVNLLKKKNNISKTNDQTFDVNECTNLLHYLLINWTAYGRPDPGAFGRRPEKKNISTCVFLV